MTQLKDRMLEELERRNYSPGTARCYLHAVQQFAEHFHRSPDQLGAEHIREYQLYLLRERKLSPKTVAQRMAALRFFYVKTLKRQHMLQHLPFPKLGEKLPTVLSREEVSRLLAASANRMHRTMLMTLYSTGVRRAELCQLKTSDIDSQRMVVHVRQGKGRRDRDVPLKPGPAGSTTRLLAMDEAEDVPVSRLGRWLAGRCTDYRQDGLVRLPESGAGCRHREAHLARIPCVTATRLTCSKPARTCARSRCCSAMPRSITPPSICTSPGVICNAVPNPLDTLAIAALLGAREIARLRKR